jgi:hypothetical protein
MAIRYSFLFLAARQAGTLGVETLEGNKGRKASQTHPGEDWGEDPGRERSNFLGNLPIPSAPVAI